MKLIDKLSPDDSPEIIEILLETINIVKECKTFDRINIMAKWNCWEGWSGNHDHRLEDATCSHCGYHHPTVYNNKDLADICPKCRALMEK